MRRLNSLLCESPWPGRERIERAGGDFVGQERAHLLAQRVAFGRQADLVEGERASSCESDQRAATSGQNSSAPRAAIRLPSATAQWLSLPKSSRQASMRSV